MGEIIDRTVSFCYLCRQSGVIGGPERIPNQSHLIIIMASNGSLLQVSGIRLVPGEYQIDRVWSKWENPTGYSPLPSEGPFRVAELVISDFGRHFLLLIAQRAGFPRHVEPSTDLADPVVEP